LIEKGTFREDLYYRLKVVEINLPPLRDRKDDVPELVGYLLEKINNQLRKNVKKIPPHVMKRLKEHSWRGNVRELENALTRAVILAKGDVILEENLPFEGGEKKVIPRELVPMKEVEKDYIQHILNEMKGNKTRTCRVLEISRPTLDKKIKEYDLKV
jgi:two-component system response regulator AtoC